MAPPNKGLSTGKGINARVVNRKIRKKNRQTKAVTDPQQRRKRNKQAKESRKHNR